MQVTVVLASIECTVDGDGCETDLSLRVLFGRDVQPTWEDVAETDCIQLGLDSVKPQRQNVFSTKDGAGAEVTLTLNQALTDDTVIHLILFGTKRHGTQPSVRGRSHLDDWSGRLGAKSATGNDGKFTVTFDWSKFPWDQVRRRSVEERRQSEALTTRLQDAHKRWLKFQSQTLARAQHLFAYPALAEVNFLQAKLPAGGHVSGGEFAALMQHSNHAFVSLPNGQTCSAPLLFVALHGIELASACGSAPVDAAAALAEGRLSARQVRPRVEWGFIEAQASIVCAHYGFDRFQHVYTPVVRAIWTKLSTLPARQFQADFGRIVSEFACAVRNSPLATVAVDTIIAWGRTMPYLSDERSDCSYRRRKQWFTVAATKEEEEEEEKRTNRSSAPKQHQSISRDQLLTVFEELPFTQDAPEVAHGGDCDDKAMASLEMASQCRELFLHALAARRAGNLKAFEQGFPLSLAIGLFLAAYSPALCLCDVNNNPDDVFFVVDDSVEGLAREKRRQATRTQTWKSYRPRFQAHCILALLPTRQTFWDGQRTQFKYAVTGQEVEPAENSRAQFPPLIIADATWGAATYPRSFQTQVPVVGPRVGALCEALLDKGFTAHATVYDKTQEAQLPVNPDWLEYVAFSMCGDGLCVRGLESGDLCAETTTETGRIEFGLDASDRMLAEWLADPAVHMSRGLRWRTPLQMFRRVQELDHSSSAQRPLPNVRHRTVDELLRLFPDTPPPSYPILRTGPCLVKTKTDASLDRPGAVSLLVRISPNRIAALETMLAEANWTVAESSRVYCAQTGLLSLCVY